MINSSEEAQLFKSLILEGHYSHGRFMCRVLETAVETQRLNERAAHDAKQQIHDFIEYLLHMIDVPICAKDNTPDLNDIPALYTCLCKVAVYKKTGIVCDQYADLMGTFGKILGKPGDRFAARDESMYVAAQIFDDWDNRFDIAKKFVNQNY